MRSAYRCLLCLALAACSIAGFVLTRPSVPTFGQERIPSSRVPACGCYVCGKLLASTFPNAAPNCAGILAADACPTAVNEQNMSADQRKAFCKILRGGLSSSDLKTQCPAYAAMCPEEPKPDCENYSGEITCDCNGDGTDDAAKTFESCGPKSNFPRQFKSRCQQWATGDGGFSFSTDIRIQRAGGEWLKSISCPAMDCHQKYAACTGPLETELQKCLTGNRLLGMRRSCQQKYTAAKTGCERARTACLNSTRRSGPAPVPQPLPTPTPGSMSLGIFDPALWDGAAFGRKLPCESS